MLLNSIQLEEPWFSAGNARLNSEGGRITYWFDLLPLNDLFVRNQLHLCTPHFFHFQNDPALTNKDRRSDEHDTSPFRIEVSITWLKGFFCTSPVCYGFTALLTFSGTLEKFFIIMAAFADLERDMQ